jgi:hypothetical protein
MNLELMTLGNTMAKPTLRRIEEECHFGGFCSECAMVFIRPWGAKAEESEKAIKEQFLAHLHEHHSRRRLKLASASAASSMSQLRPH